MTIRLRNFLFALSFQLAAQLNGQLLNLDVGGTVAEGKPVEVTPLASDSLSSSFLIYIHDEVAPHYHAEHSEHVVILEGTGTMLLNDSLIQLKPQTAVFIPKGSIHSAKRTGDKPLKAISIQAPFFDGKDRIPVQKKTGEY
jgi:mannose-6-phosphate isomerase-like protein (cupin superfamily)